MNKFAKTLCMMAVVVLAFTSCKKNNQDVKSMAFNGSFEQFQVEESDYRAYIDNTNTIRFEDGDEVMLFNIVDPANSQSAKYEVSNNGTKLNLVDGTIDPTTDGSYYAFYPAGNVTPNLGDENKAVFTLAGTQTYRSNAGAPVIPAGALYTAAKDATHKTLTQTFFEMKNICGILELNLYSASGKTVRSITVTDNAFNLVGDMTLKIDQVNPSEMTTLFYNYGDPAYETQLAAYMNQVGYYAANTNNSVTLNCGTGVALSTDASNPTQFFIVLRPLALRHGCVLTIEFTDDSVETYESTKPNVIKPNYIRVIKAMQVG
jgi:hypothetical protein